MPLERVKISDSVLGTIRKYDMLAPGDRLVVGVSGGADSVCLLHALAELAECSLSLVVAHLHHGIRGDEAERDLHFVEALAQGLNLPFESSRVDAPKFSRDSHLSLEDAARSLRYEFFRRIADKCGAQKIATAHTLDDQAETVLMRLIRGSGRAGLSGIAPVSEDGRIVRPLINTPKSAAIRYLTRRGISWVEDSTNISREILRNRIRLDLLPRLREYNPNVVETLARTAEILRAEGDFIESRAGNWIEYAMRSADEGELIGSVSRYKLIPKALKYSFLRAAIAKVKGDLKQISSVHLISADELLMSASASGEISLPAKIHIARGYDLFSIARKGDGDEKFRYEIPSPGRWIFPDAQIEVDYVESAHFGGERYTAHFDARCAQFPIEVSNFNDGMRFHPLGMRGAKKLKRFFIDEKIPRFARRRVPIFLTKGEVIWVGGMRVDERFKAEPNGRALRITLAKPRWIFD
ncbi:MAG: tRNA lysidine(34) synthetase TilS [Deltaproteobacteria bacterium]